MSLLQKQLWTIYTYIIEPQHNASTIQLPLAKPPKFLLLLHHHLIWEKAWWMEVWVEKASSQEFQLIDLSFAKFTKTCAYVLTLPGLPRPQKYSFLQMRSSEVRALLHSQKICFYSLFKNKTNKRKAQKKIPHKYQQYLYIGIITVGGFFSASFSVLSKRNFLSNIF